ncbi:MAG: hypothetical protein HY094_01480 [Candidatus Melainabacteria bacterium]|nr:hypothetical protein [Candidatus Melainabacteria bacterium]
MKEKIVLLLFINKNTPQIPKFLEDFRRIIDERYGDEYELDLQVLDILDNWEQAKAVDVKVTPTLFKSNPMPIAKVTGDLADIEKVIVLLGLKKPL